MSRKKCEPGCTCAKHEWSAERRQRRSEISKAIWQDPEYVSRQSEAHKGYEFTDEHRRHLSEAHQGREVSAETRQKISEAQRGKRSVSGEPAQGFSISGHYKILTGQQGHPLANGDGALPEHRKVLYDNVGPGSHPCHWCGQVLEWNNGIDGIFADHLDDDGLNNDPANLVPSCHYCNWNRSKWWFGRYLERKRLCMTHAH